MELKLIRIFKDIKLEHTIFSLPFALAAAVLAAQGIPDTRTLALIVLALLFARSAAMAFNRLADADFDSLNPRTKNRAIPSGKVKKTEMLLFVIINALAFIAVSFMLGKLPGFLSPVALFIIFGYSYCKRFTSLSHLFLGLSLSLAPLGSWIAVTGKISLTPILLSLGVIFWLAGFDTIYSLQDIEFDRLSNLYSIPARLGAKKGLLLARLFHLVTLAFFVLTGITASLGKIYFFGLILIGLTLIFEHSLLSPDDLSRINLAFFNSNGIISLTYLFFVFLDWLVRL